MIKYCPTCKSNTHFNLLYGEFWGCATCNKPLRDRNVALRGFRMKCKGKVEGNVFGGEIVLDSEGVSE